jgi:hypothetical protein
VQEQAEPITRSASREETKWKQVQGKGRNKNDEQKICIHRMRSIRRRGQNDFEQQKRREKKTADLSGSSSLRSLVRPPFVIISK